MVEPRLGAELHNYRIKTVYSQLLVDRKLSCVQKIAIIQNDRGREEVQLLEALRCKPKSCGFDYRFCDWNFSLTYSFQPHYVPVVDLDYNRNEHQEYFLEVKASGA